MTAFRGARLVIRFRVSIRYMSIDICVIAKVAIVEPIFRLNRHPESTSKLVYLDCWLILSNRGRFFLMLIRYIYNPLPSFRINGFRDTVKESQGRQY